MLELIEAASLNIDLSMMPLNDFDRFETSKTKKSYYVAILDCKMKLVGISLEVEISCNGRVLCSAKVKDMEDSQSQS